MAVNPSIFGVCPQFENTAGEPAVGDKLFFYIAGSNTKQNTFTSSTGVTANANPVILNSLGQPTNELWWTSGALYKMVWAPSTDTDPPTNPIRTWDNLSGINTSSPSATIDEWVLYSAAPTFVSTTSFSVVGNQTATFNVGRRVKTTNSGGTVYSSITASVFGSVTTVTVTNDSGVLDSGISAVYYALLSASNPSVPTIYARSGVNADITQLTALTTVPTVVATAIAGKTGMRQTVFSGPVDTNGFSAFGGSTGTTTVTASGTLILGAANGFSSTGTTDLVGSITNPSWTSLSTNGTMYLYLDIAANGTCTTGSTTLVPVYQWGGTYSVTSNQFTFNIQEMVGKVGNGATAAQTYRVFVGEVTVAGAVVTAITWYALMGRYDSGYTATLIGINSSVSKNHNIGSTPLLANLIIECTTTDNGYAVGDQIMNPGGKNGAPSATPNPVYASRLTVGTATANDTAYFVQPKTGASNVGLTAASWKYKLIAQRTW